MDFTWNIQSSNRASSVHIPLFRTQHQSLVSTAHSQTKAPFNKDESISKKTLITRLIILLSVFLFELFQTLL